MTRSSNPLPDFNVQEWLEACAERRQIRARLSAIKEELAKLSSDNNTQKLAVEALAEDTVALTQQSIVSLMDYRDYKNLIADAQRIKKNVNETEAGLRNERVVLEHKLGGINSEIKQVKEIFRRAMRKVVSFERYRSQAVGS